MDLLAIPVKFFFDSCEFLSNGTFDDVKINNFDYSNHGLSHWWPIHAASRLLISLQYIIWMVRRTCVKFCTLLFHYETLYISKPEQSNLCPVPCSFSTRKPGELVLYSTGNQTNIMTWNMRSQVKQMQIFAHRRDPGVTKYREVSKDYLFVMRFYRIHTIAYLDFSITKKVLESPHPPIFCSFLHFFTQQAHIENVILKSARTILSIC